MLNKCLSKTKLISPAPSFSPTTSPLPSPHIIFLSQSVLDVAVAGPSGGVPDRSLLGSRLCHELAHSWFGLAIGARDWTEEWISEGFATYLEDVIWAKAQQVGYSGNARRWHLRSPL